MLARPLMGIALLAVAGCLAAPAPQPSVSPPVRRTVTPPPIGTPAPGASTATDLTAIRRIERLAPWVRHEAGQTYFTFLFYDKDHQTVFFAIKPPLAVRYRFTRPGETAPLAQGTAEMAADALKFDLALPSPLPPRLHASFSVALPDERTLSGELDVPVEGAPE